MVYSMEQQQIDLEEIRLWEKGFKERILSDDPNISEDELYKLMRKAKIEYFTPMAQKIWMEMHTE